MGLHADPGALKNVGHRVSRSSIARILKAQGIRRCGSGRLVADVSAGALGRDRGADFFTTEVWTWRGLVTYYTVFVIDLASRRVQIVGSTPHPDERSCGKSCVRSRPRMTGCCSQHRVLICDRDAKRSAPVRDRLATRGSAWC